MSVTCPPIERQDFSLTYRVSREEVLEPSPGCPVIRMKREMFEDISLGTIPWHMFPEIPGCGAEHNVVGPDWFRCRRCRVVLLSRTVLDAGPYDEKTK